MSQFQPPPQGNTGYSQWQQPPYPPQPETYYAPQQFTPPELPPQSIYANPQTYYPPQVPMLGVPPPSRTLTLRIYLLAIVAIILVGSAFGITVIALTSHSAPAATPGTQINTQATGDAAATANSNAIGTADANASAQLTAQAMTPTAPPVTPTPSTDLGSTLSSGSWSITINSIKPTVSDNQFEVPKPGNEFILINFTALNTDVSAHDMNPFYFTLRDGSGTSYDYTGLTVARSPDGTVVGGQKLRGDLSYEIPKSLHSLTLQFDSPEDFNHSQVVQWNLTV